MSTMTMAAAPMMAMIVSGSMASAFSGVATITTSATSSTIAIRRNGAVFWIMARIIRIDPSKPRICRKGGGSGQERATVQLVDGGQQPVQVRPRDGRREPERLLPDGDQQSADHRPAIVELKLLAAVGPDAPGAQPGMVPVEQRRLEASATLRIPVHRHHVGDITDGTPHAPVRPVDEADAVGAGVPRIEQVPHVGVTVDDGAVLSQEGRGNPAIQ